MKILFLGLFFVILHAHGLSQTNPCNTLYKREIHDKNMQRVDLEPVYFFSYTQPDLKSFFKQNNFISTYAQLSKNNGVFYLHLNVKLASSIARVEYGKVEKGSTLTLKTIRGSQIDLVCVKESQGKIDKKNNSTIYTLSYVLDQKHVKKISKNLIDKVGILWTTGYEEYEVYEVDALKNQMQCMKSLNML